MSDSENRKAVNDNTKSIKDLTKKFADFASKSGGSSNEENSGTGIKAVDNKINDLKEAFTNNTTVKFFKDPVGQITGGFKSVLSPITSIGDSFKDAFGKIGGFFGGGKATKIDKQMLKHLKSIDKNIKGGFANMTQEGFSLNNEAVLSEAIGQTVGREFISKTGFGRSVGFLTKIQTSMSLLPTAIMGAGAKVFTEKLKPLGEKLGKLTIFGDFFKQKGDLDKGLPEGFAELYSQNSDRSERDQKFHNESTGLFGDIKAGFGHLLNATNNMSNVIRESVGLDPIELSNATASALEASDADKDQVEREARKDDKLFQIGQNEQLLLALDKASEKFGLRSVKESIKGTSFSIIGYFKKLLAGAGTAAIGGAVGVGTGIAGFFKAIGSGFMFMGANLPMFAKGAAAIALMGASFIPFAGALYLINQALEGMTFKKIGMFATTLTVMGAAIAGFGLAMSTGVGAVVVMAGIAALAAAGAALIPFGYAMKLAGSGLESAAVLFAELGEVGWDKVGKAGGAIKDLAVAFRDLSFGGLIQKITGGGFSGFVSDLADFGQKATGITLLADAIEKLVKNITPLKDMKFTTNLGELLNSITKQGEKMDGGFFTGVNMKKASEGIELFLGKITAHLAANENRAGLLKSMNQLLENSMGAATFFAQSGNTSSAFVGQIDPALTRGMQTPVIINQGGSDTTSNSVNYTTNDIHLNNRTLEFVLGAGGQR
jgi:hypothetical protein